MLSDPRSTTRSVTLRRRVGALTLLTLLAALVAWINTRRSPSPPAAKPERIYIADWANHRVVRMDDMTGAGWTAIGEGQFSYPVGVCVDAAGGLVVTEQRHHRIVRIDDPCRPQWTRLRPPDAESKRVNKHAGSWVAVDAVGRIYVTADGEHRVVRMDDMSGTNRVAFGTEGSGDGQFRDPAGVCIDSQGR